MKYKYYINHNTASEKVVRSIVGGTTIEEATKKAITNYLYNASCRILSFEYKKGIVVTVEIIPAFYTIRKIMWSFLSYMQLEHCDNSHINVNYINTRVKFPNEPTLEKAEKNLYKFENRY